jgi:hypothetical protein
MCNDRFGDMAIDCLRFGLVVCFSVPIRVAFCSCERIFCRAKILSLGSVDIHDRNIVKRSSKLIVIFGCRGTVVSAITDGTL